MKSVKRINPFTCKTFTEDGKPITNKYSREFHETYIEFFARRNSFSRMLEMLQETYPDLDLNLDKIKNYYMVHSEEFLSRRDEYDGCFDDITAANEEALIHSAREEEHETLEDLLEEQKRMRSALKVLTPEEQPKSYINIVAALNKCNTMINEISGLKHDREIKQARRKMMLAMEMKKEMIKQGLLPQIAPPSDANDLLSDNDSNKESFRPTILDAEVVA